MRALSACLTVLLGLGMVGLAACSSSSSDDSAAAGSGGADTGGSGGAATAGSGGSDIGAAGAGPECSFTSDACEACIKTSCSDEFSACMADDSTCGAALGPLGLCLCDSTTSTADCETTFETAGGDSATAFAMCVDTDCQAECE
jgi:hypothetical protein